MHFIAESTDTDTDVMFLKLIVRSNAYTAILCSLDIADNIDFGHNFDFIADTDTEKWPRPRFLPTF